MISTQKLPKRQLQSIQFTEFKKIVVISLILVLLGGLLYLNLTYIDNRVVISGNNIVSSSVIIEKIASDINSNPVASVNSDLLKKKISESSEYIKDVKVIKSLTSGYIIEIKEYEPEAIIKTQSEEFYLLTKNLELIKVKESPKDLIQLNYLGGNIDDIVLIPNAKKTLKIFNEINDIIDGIYNFDNFGNLSILLSEDKIVRFDLSEKFFSVEDQVKLVRSKLESKINYNEIDIRFSYLLIK